MNQAEKMLLLKQAVDTWGENLQLIIVLEETAELQKEVCKMIRGDWSSQRMDSLASEIADVSLMLEQLIFITSTASAVEKWKDIKLNRLAKRLKGE